MGNKGSNISALADCIKNAGKRHVKTQVAWAEVKSVNWGDKTMVATGVSDGLDYLDVSLGIGNVYKKPKEGSLCQVGMLENQDAAMYMIDAESVEEVEINMENGIQVKIKPDGYYIRKGSVSMRSVFDKLKSLLENFKVNTPSGPSVGLLPDTMTALIQFENEFKTLLK